MPSSSESTSHTSPLGRLFAPAPPREKFFRELAEIADSGRELSAREWAEFYARHDQYPA